MALDQRPQHLLRLWMPSTPCAKLTKISGPLRKSSANSSGIRLSLHPEQWRTLRHRIRARIGAPEINSFAVSFDTCPRPIDPETLRPLESWAPAPALGEPRSGASRFDAGIDRVINPFPNFHALFSPCPQPDSASDRVRAFACLILWSRGDRSLFQLRADSTDRGIYS